MCFEECPSILVCLMFSHNRLEFGEEQHRGEVLSLLPVWGM